ncbi:protein kinase domain protein [Carpediemonas membranifera]|uniref:Protein kinase domain protein n=1 Tax=Carpediemonas membranifera TaxID=201153 RepID=A0A8J6B6J7_9EUKA|nr:protein kinase domain protein [Carpediemonas membranifera]|eukprot:KAG9396723.1 protein kinase domain protein [Carpediemonas membranifera]
MAEEKDYSEKEYWTQRYENLEHAFDWYCEYSAVAPTIKSLVKTPETARVLIVGVGNSRMAHQMATDGFRGSIVAIDIADNVISFMNEHNPDPTVEFISMDVTLLDLDSESFDVVVDKGTFDGIACAEQADGKLEMACREIHRVLKPAGTFCCISHSDSRGDDLRGPEWTIRHSEVKPESLANGRGAYHMYLAEKPDFPKR